MKLCTVAQVYWTVLAVCSNRGECQLLEFLGGLDARAWHESKHMLVLIARTAEYGPSSNGQLCSSLGDDIYELRKSGLRVLFFYDMEHTIICTHAYKKRGSKLGHGQKSRALAARAAYFDAKRAGKLEVMG
jgi:phage-related protein